MENSPIKRGIVVELVPNGMYLRTKWYLFAYLFPRSYADF